MSFKNLFILVVLLIASQYAAASFKSIQVIDYEILNDGSGDIAIFSDDGQIYDLIEAIDVEVEIIKSAKTSRSRLIIKLSKNSHSEDLLGIRNNILEVGLASQSERSIISRGNTKNDFSPTMLNNDYVTNFTSEKSVEQIFNSQNKRLREESQCYNRAHIWAYEMRKYREEGRPIQPGKMWLYFTKKYISEYRYKWWFHVAPYVTLRGKDFVLDRKFLSGPISLRGWTDFFIKPRTECPFISKYSQYRDIAHTGDCLIMKTSVHYYQPYQMELLERGENPEQKKWEEWELKQAYKDGVGTSRYPRY